MDAVLHGEVRDARPCRLGVGLGEPALALHVALEGGPGGLEVAGEGVVGGQLFEPLLVDARQELDGVTAHLPPEVRIDADEELLGHGRPRPPEVVGNVPQALERGRKPWDHVEVPEGAGASNRPGRRVQQ